MTGDLIANADVSVLGVDCDCGFTGRVEVSWHGPVGQWFCHDCASENEVEL